MHDGDVLYRHIVPSAFRSRMGGGLMSGRTAAAIALWLIRRGFRYVPVTYTGIAFLNFVPFFLRCADLSCRSWIIGVSRQSVWTKGATHCAKKLRKGALDYLQSHPFCKKETLGS